ncbi:MAG TPA: signal recognition particle-docking protein FtsY [Steroidobacter sp.]|uniref:signal recognition particle-docking protein FtsY n=1 Tax=Steroidobacter sp. TaxID=1978227 RepID=UPI002ED9806C
MFGFKNKRPASDPPPAAASNGSSTGPGNDERAGLFQRLRAKLNRGDSWLTYDLANLIPGGKIDEAVLDELEMRLITADVGVETSERILAALRKKVARNELSNLDALLEALREQLMDIVRPVAGQMVIDSKHIPFVVLVVGVNGAGKTTTIGKLARIIKAADMKVMLAAGDTFRAAAVEQLQVWGQRNDVPVIAQATGADPAAVVFDALQSAQARKFDVLIADTAGRLHTQSNLMDELKKVKRVMARLDPSAPHEVLLVLDASQGQNALQQAKLFNEALGVTGVVLTKLDGTAKGGIVFAIASELKLPIRYLGVGESVEDFVGFDPAAFVDALLKRD